ncbi:glycosyl transferase family 41-domain-containing protein [Thelonectria olida]|uniref:protein O-GlcNAc transferase n=1 Tax=Thelonectria olida TaxID=1576542 RepID=A0A9P9ASY5_9HYPO|nr:glycosyl transferase family 41-domain-containing protein [Thelonectria olida]
MFPLLQMPPPAVTPPSSNLDVFAPFPSNSSPSARSRHPRNVSATHQRSFPIRTSQPQRRPSAPTDSSFYRPHPDYHLRRKTPNGTLDAGYDGSPTPLSHGPPPLKHLVLPRSVTSTAFPPTAPPGHPIRNHDRTNGYDQTSPPGHDDSRAFHMSSMPWPVDNNMPHPGSFETNAQSFNIPIRQQQPVAYLDASGMFPSLHQPLMRANEYNVRAFCPPPVVMNDSLPLEQIPMQLIPSPWNHGTLIRPPQPQQDLESLSHKRIPEYLHHSSFDSSVEREVPFNQPRSMQPNFENLGYDMINAPHRPQPSRYGPQHGFREKVLFQAHRSYMDLINYLQTSRRSHSTNSVSVIGASAKLLVYPKPPRPSLKTIDAGERGALARFPERHYGPNYHEGSHAASHSLGSFGNSFSGAKISIFAMAKSSLEMLNSLCEQSGWNWSDGMLLGGCLHYGMEQYEEALEWFSMIITLDSSHVEAITNKAAALYCLNRQNEAEQHWIQAVQVQPSYLEAVEHLVGLLYKQRSREAIEIIDQVQQALRLPSSRPLQPARVPTSKTTPQESFAGTTAAHSFRIADLKQAQHPGVAPQSGDVETSGFGSSGYAIPGTENGRILALIHAKGTMLYSLKDVRGASEAFEEAVLISVGRQITGIQDLVRRIQTVLSSAGPRSTQHGRFARPRRPLLLPPEKARHTAHLVFGGAGDLPGLRYVTEGNTRRAAVQTTSNSLLSLAKIFQDALSTGQAASAVLKRPSGVEDILALYYLSLSLQESPSTANNVGILLAGVQQSSPNSQVADVDMFSQPNFPGIAPGSGLALALAYYHYGLRLDPKHVHLHTNLGSLLKDIGQLDLAIQMYEQAVSCDGTFDIALTNLANAVKDRGRISDAIGYYKRAVNSNPDFAEAVCGLSTALNSVCDWRGRGGVILRSGHYDRWHVDDRGLLVDARSLGHSSGLTSRVVQIIGKQLSEASHWGRGTLENGSISVLAEHVRAHCSSSSFHSEKALQGWAGKRWEGSRIVRLVERATRIIQWKWYHDLYVSRSDTASQYSRPRLPSNLTVPSAPTVLPFHTFTCPLSARDIRTISQRNAIRISCSTLRLPWIPATVFPPPPPPNPRLNVGYVSSDFNNHPLAHLMQSVFGFHNPQRVRAFCYATTASDRSIHRQQIEREAPVFRDVSSWPSDKLVQQIIQDEIHILVNLNGYTRGARNEIFAARPAPIQMSFMGFAGTLGAEWCDYILADSTAIPAETLRPWRSNVRMEDVFQDNTEGDGEDWMYSENIIFCRDTFFCCDHAQSCDTGERRVTWEEEQERRWKMRKELFPTLPDDVIIMGNFNQLYKIEPTTFRSWLRILAQVPKAILWLLRFPELGEVNLRRTAKAWAGAEVASRLIFTDVAPKSQHISRARVCDIFLDTPECNAHTTAADVLWSSTPLLTLPRYPYKMCSRMAASILRGALPESPAGERVADELIVGSETEYEQQAVWLVGGLRYQVADGGYGEAHGRLAEMRKLLWDSKWQCGLFDTRRWVADLEMAYEEAWRRWVAGKSGDIHL